MKYFLSIGAIFKNESNAMKQWLDHYIKEGVEHFYMINNASTDNFMDIIKQYDCITLFNDSGSGIQVSGYNKYIYPKALEETEYIGIFDLDEFAYASNDDTLSSILKKEPLCKYDHIWCPWLRFGSNSHIEQPESIIQGFIKRRQLKDDVLGKSIAKTASLKKLEMHCHKMLPTAKCGISNGTDDITHTDKHSVTEEQDRFYMIWVNHYEIQSYNWFHQVKATRGDGNRGVTYNRFNQEKTSFSYMDKQCILTDTRLLDKKYK
jgi:hypothetical protein